MNKDMVNLRKEIDEVDLVLLSLFQRRFFLVEKIGTIKKDNGISALDKERWQQVITTRKKQAKALGLAEEFIQEIYGCIHKYSLQIEEKLNL